MSNQRYRHPPQAYGTGSGKHPLAERQGDLLGRWSPAPGVVIDPDIRVGRPCVDGTRVDTWILAETYRTYRVVAQAGWPEAGTVESVAEDWGLTADQVRAALAYEGVEVQE